MNRASLTAVTGKAQPVGPPAPSAAWAEALRSGSRNACAGRIQIAGWELLSAYLNGGTGAVGLLFPAAPAGRGESVSIAAGARALAGMWMDFSEVFGGGAPFVHSGVLRASMVLCAHYGAIESLARGLGGRDVRIACHPGGASRRGPAVEALALDVARLGPLVHSYWLHGSVGSGDPRPGWSDLDGLAIVSRAALASPSALECLRAGLIAARSRFLDYMPYQLHGHFVLAEPDLEGYPAPFFPETLFANAHCLDATVGTLALRERTDRSLALEMLWRQGVTDLLAGLRPDADTLEKIAFLHRVYLLPCLVAQAKGAPLFKREAFLRLDDLFPQEDAEVIRRASEVWSGWQLPAPAARSAVRLARVLRFNPMLYQAASHWIGRRLPWLARAPRIDWGSLARGMARVAAGAWRRVAGEGADG